MKKDFLSITDLSKEEIIYLIELAITLKEELINNGIMKIHRFLIPNI